MTGAIEVEKRLQEFYNIRCTDKRSGSYPGCGRHPDDCPMLAVYQIIEGCEVFGDFVFCAGGMMLVNKAEDHDSKIEKLEQNQQRLERNDQRLERMIWAVNA